MKNSTLTALSCFLLLGAIVPAHALICPNLMNKNTLEKFREVVKEAPCGRNMCRVTFGKDWLLDEPDKHHLQEADLQITSQEQKTINQMEFCIYNTNKGNIELLYNNG